MGSVFDLDQLPDEREPCNACMMACYRSASALIYAGVAGGDAVRALAAGRPGHAVASLFQRGVAQSLWALIEDIPNMRHDARRRKTAGVAPEVAALGRQPHPTLS